MDQPPLFDNPPAVPPPPPKSLSVKDAHAQLKHIAKQLYIWASDTKMKNPGVSDFLLNTSRRILESVYAITHPSDDSKNPGGNTMKGPAYGLTFYFNHMAAPSKFSKANAIADLLRQGVTGQAIKNAAASSEDLDFYDVMKLLRQQNTGGSYEKQVRQASQRGPHGQS